MPNVSPIWKGISMPKKRPFSKRPYSPRAGLSPAINPKLTLEQVREIRKVFKMADKLQKARGSTRAPPGLANRLAIKYRVSERTIIHIRANDRWSTQK